MRAWVLGSGSRGNAVVLESAGAAVLVDAGFPAPELAARLARIGVAPEAVEALLLTHEHTDHVRGACAAARRWGWAVYATAGTIAACPALARVGATVLDPAEPVQLSELSVRAVPTPHDAAEPVALVATSRGSGARAAVAYDLGHTSAPLREALREVDVLVLEANHDEGMLRAGPYPPAVRHRIAGAHGHLSNRAAAAVARACAGPRLAHVVLAHLSASCNDPALAHREVATALGREMRGRTAVSVAAQERVVGPFVPAGRRSTMQLALAL